MTMLYCAQALLPDGWSDGVVVSVDETGAITSVETGQEAPQDSLRLNGITVPGMPNLHSHAFQRAMAGLAEVAGPTDDSFWTWRKVMYGFLDQLQPEDLEAIAGQLYVDMLKAGYTSVGEFHYVHHQPSGEPYDVLSELSDRIIAASKNAGIAVTHLPVLYAHGGFGGQTADAGQRRFLNDGDRFLTLFDQLSSRYSGDPQVTLGIAPHSLRAVTPELLGRVLEGVNGIAPGCPLHIHIAEQTKEVDDCVAWSGQRPVAWLMDNVDVTERWCLIHATHMDPSETAGLAASGAVAGLCPTTEANLGDGFFPAPEYLAAGGRFGIGSDSHISVSVYDELRTLEYGHRLRLRQRNVLSQGEGQSTGAGLYRSAIAGGSQAMGRCSGAIAPGHRADLVVLDDTRPEFAGRSGDQILDAWMFAAHRSPVRDVICGGVHVIRDGHHADEEAIATEYTRTLQRLLA